MTTWTIGTSKTASTWSVENKYAVGIPWSEMTAQWANTTGAWDSYATITAPTWTSQSKS